MLRWLVEKWSDLWQKIILRIRWKFRNLTGLDIPLGLIDHQIQNMFLNAK